MINSIKSVFFIRKLFSNLTEKVKLEIIKYNKTFQNIIDISIINYRIFSRKYIIYNSDGKGNEYSGYEDEDNSLIFEGEYKNGKRNGKGKEYSWNKVIIYEGEYKNGKRNGKGKEYDDEGNIKFQGEYKNGERNGYGKEYYEGNLEFEGEYLNGERNGKGKEYDENGKLKNEDDYLNGNKWIKVLEYSKSNNCIYGKEYDYSSNLLKFQGDYLNEKRNGKGQEYDDYENLKYEGEYINGERNGKGKEYDINGNLIFEGEYKNGLKRNGKIYEVNNILFLNNFLIN